MRFFAATALLPDGPARDVLFDVADGRFTAVAPLSRRPPEAAALPGVVLPGLANGHSHAFHRALRGRTHGDGGTFWTWRQRMYALAARLDPDTYLALARATYAEMALAGVTGVGEFHYLHHAAGGARYDDPNAMAEALRQAAADAGVRLTVLDACYLAGGLEAGGHLPLSPVQQQFSDGDAESWAQRVEQLKPSDGLRVGAAIHSVRAVPREALGVVASAVAGAPVHVHLSEQPAENEACRAFHGASPTELLSGQGVLGRGLTAVHATHLTDRDVALLGAAHVTVCACPTTERDLGDGLGRVADLLAAGCAVGVGSDQHTVIDVLEEARGVEAHERLRTHTRGVFSPQQLLTFATDHACIGWPDAGRLAVGARADLVAVRTDTVRTAGCDPAQVVAVAGAGDVDTVVVDGRVVVEGGRHVLGDVAALMTRALAPLAAPR